MPLGDDLAGEAAVGAAALARPPAFPRPRAPFPYEGGRDMVLRFKHGERTDYAPAFAAWLNRAGAPLLTDADLLIPVPLHRWRLLARRFNQSALLANALSRISAVTCLPDALVRTRATPSQGALVWARARGGKVLWGFAVGAGARAAVAGRRVVLIDDVMTTGATLEAAARALTRGGAADVRAPEKAVYSNAP